MEKQDIRINKSSEILSNIKMIKLYSWTKLFERDIISKRAAELKELWKKIIVDMLMGFSIVFFISFIPVLVFSVFVYSGNTLDLSLAFTAMALFEILNVIHIFLNLFRNPSLCYLFLLVI